MVKLYVTLFFIFQCPINVLQCFHNLKKNKKKYEEEKKNEAINPASCF